MADDTDTEDDGMGFFDSVTAIFTGAQATLQNIVTTGLDDATTVATGGQDSLTDVFTGAQDTIGDTVSNVAAGAQQGLTTVVTGAQATLQAAVNPWNLFGLGAGGVFVAGLFTIGGALVADELFAGGAVRTALFSGSKRRRR